MQNKMCPKCKEILDVSAFNKSNRRDGYQTYCRSCHNKIQREKYNSDPIEKVKRQIRESRRKQLNPLAKKREELKRLYNLTLEEYVEIYKSQGEVCAICKRNCKTKKSLSVDHNHATGKVRGLLCNTCNTALGMFLDSPVLLKRASDYLERDSA
jgi:hypothetical protein